MKKTLVAAGAGALLIACGGMRTMATAPIDTDITALEQACVRDPLDAAKWEALAAALATSGERERAATMYLQAATLRTHDMRGDYALLKEELKDARVAEAEAVAEIEAALPRTRVRRIGAALVEVLRVPARESAAPPAVSSATVRLEISNGNGVTGAAARLARSLDVDGLKTVRLSNVRPFVVPLSRIEYQYDQQLLAQRLGDRLNLPLRKLRGNPAHADMRIVLGHDVRNLK